jgi:uncharacterized protein (DUF58 family)
MPVASSALRRTKGILRPREAARETDRGAYVSVADLVALESAARDFSFLPRQPVHSLLWGRHGSRIRGRGLDFEDLRLYFPGDDIRTMDWRVTARTRKPHVRVYTEEKDRPVLFVVDQRINMFFGTRRAMKSVAAAEVMALGAWRVLAQGDRVGGFVFGDERVDEVRPQRSRAAVMHLLETIAVHNHALRADSPARRVSTQLDAALEAAARLATHDYLVVVGSDFDGATAHTRDLMLRLAMHNDVMAVLVYDPFLLELPKSGQLVVSDGELQVELAFGDHRARKSIFDFADAYAKKFLAWQNEIGVPVLPLSAAEETAPQLRHLLGQVAWQQRRR